MHGLRTVKIITIEPKVVKNSARNIKIYKRHQHTRISEHLGVSPITGKSPLAPPPQAYIPTLVPLDTLHLLTTLKSSPPALTHTTTDP